MLFKDRILEGIERGEVTLAFRRWKKPTVKPGGTLRTPVGVLAIEAVDAIELGRISAREAKKAGFGSRDEALGLLEGRAGTLYRIAFRLAGADPRIALREQSSISEEERAELEARLGRLDRASKRGPWTRTVLELIALRPGVRAPDLAASLGLETLVFKTDVRKLKELGLTESLVVGYQLSPRGCTFTGKKLEPAPRSTARGRNRPRGSPRPKKRR